MNFIYFINLSYQLLPPPPPPPPPENPPPPNPEEKPVVLRVGVAADRKLLIDEDKLFAKITLLKCLVE